MGGDPLTLKTWPLPAHAPPDSYTLTLPLDGEDPTSVASGQGQEDKGLPGCGWDVPATPGGLGRTPTPLSEHFKDEFLFL